MTELQALAARLEEAVDYTAIFPDVDAIREVYRELARITHPDRAGYGQHALSTQAFQRLTRFKDDAEAMAAEGRFGSPVTLAVITTRRATHRVLRRYGQDEMALYYQALTIGTGDRNGFTTMLKVAKSAKDNDLMATEAKALKTLHADADQLTRHYPVLHDSFVHSEGRRRANVTTRYDQFHSLQTIRERFPSGLDPRHGAWIFRRLLMALGYAHERDLIHGAVTPDNVLVGPEDHAVVLIDWCYSVVIDSESKTNFIKAVVPTYTAHYAPEVFAKEAPSPATDLYMAATLMTHLMPIAPKAFRAFFKGVALTKPSMRPQNAWGLLKEFDELLEGIGEPFHPRRFVEFAVPLGAAS